MGQGSNLSGFLSPQIPQYDKKFVMVHYSLLSYVELCHIAPNKVTSSEFREYSYFILILLLKCVYFLSTTNDTKLLKIDHIIPITLDICFGTTYFRKYLLTFPLVKIIIIFVKSIKSLRKYLQVLLREWLLFYPHTPQHFTQ